jgi:hypothetical protein
LIDLHTHSTESDGSLEPERLVAEAARAGVTTLAITDHDTLGGYDRGLAAARAAGVRLVCGIELSTKLHGRSVHLLGYFPAADGLADFRRWLLEMQASRRDRNRRLAARLRELGFELRLEEAEELGRGMTGRPHFAQLLLRKGYVSSIRQAFDDYLDESAIAYVPRREPQFAEVVRRIAAAGGVSSLAHPLRLPGGAADALPELCAAGLQAIEAYHSDHGPEETARYLRLAQRYGLKVTGGSDFHGDIKPEVRLGAGCAGNLRVPPEVLEGLL